MNYKKKAKVMTDDFWNDLMEEGIDLTKILSYQDDIDDVNKAIKVLNDFKNEMENNNILIYY